MNEAQPNPISISGTIYVQNYLIIDHLGGRKLKAAFKMTGDGGYRVHLSGDPSTFQPEATYTLRY